MAHPHICNWMIKNMDTETKRKVKAYAARHDLVIADALKQLLEKALGDIAA